ncbi:PadR family transcriptional regulator [Anaerobacillus isosaccharinicus]|uniref:PadR family transcriptional regulator n=1 Tax=Anaerobacillus isosaccharinicus TaxID=1532552 RepID=A0A1S2L4V2_9BACI|nr:PadR family transcriptional regulator [Anaerobacillus isosaccharinicus]MBA5587163.1 PadR family transcriptional regulator [Anaerobacillus isosaccharinicus]QOY34641.1 PadR family transcriptional regulator [Anaerobacillus isosaccharinicus]
MEIEKESLKGYIDSILLSLVENKPMYGYSLSKEITELTGGLFEIKEATLYLSLKRLEKNGFVYSYWDDSSGAGGRRKYYSITPVGSERLEKQKKEWVVFKEIIDRFLGRDISNDI